MIGLDTNVLVRYFAQDDPVQARKAGALIESLTPERPGYVSQVALVEVIWVLGRAYRVERVEIARVIETLLRTKEVVVEAAETVWKALRLYVSSSADFADCLIERACHEAHCEYTATFDTKAAKSTGMRLIK
ncbi:PIN domain-containing protein [Dyella choica]|uniref:PIN domain-containing protein n=1 Tax=Dyella choica TaxID=1927959 RepID=A0A3S0R0R7_9GAMM|nr:type II toxin-antitoxin system VapC family toxin [Dyella choica]RUL70150.1 PIN domain-containing protein [Dyella choica]